MVPRIALALLMCLTTTVSAQEAPQGHHGERHAEFHAWYNTLHDRNGTSCCHDRDCRPTQSRQHDGKIQVLVDGEWLDVPPDTLLNKPAPDLGDHVCALPKEALSWGRLTSRIMCVVLGKGV